jgi:hypothetical protein
MHKLYIVDVRIIVNGDELGRMWRKSSRPTSKP